MKLLIVKRSADIGLWQGPALWAVDAEKDDLDF